MYSRKCLTIVQHDYLNVKKQLILSKALDAAATYLQKKTRTKCSKIRRVPRATVILIFTQTARLAEDDKNSAKEVLNTIKITYPETTVVYITSRNNADSYLELAKDYVNDAVIKATETEPIQNVMPEIIQTLIKIPNRIMDFYCNNTVIYMEDYLTPGESKIYELHSEYIRRVDFVVKFKGYDYGDASVCVYDSKTPMNKICKGVGGNDEVTFLPNNYCIESYPCNVQFLVEVAKTNFKCSEFDCRYPDQMRIEITSTWTKRSGSTTIRYNIYGVVVVLLGICLTYEH
ncbi:hypothetical protein FQA39_LY04562 [Lamprigera yunnana]|nr:hypothetical protein FQA39_LY04562 [Lamprigera yunnana]